MIIVWKAVQLTKKLTNSTKSKWWKKDLSNCLFDMEKKYKKLTIRLNISLNYKEHSKTKNF